ncbi:capsular exopolysaccharide family [Paenibacillus curdlanolyticus YK9]|uniref:Capsular exopolysaccharide family n=1 Tax=Paenibacillus curdlanolyticus YK9 TaxID=717606 RepID=E0IES0_9BACL|nr:CpsD/CapB family tyrosine-protein kinase [Paenibacillus curdlanolyticus]EFM09158.1 capsular exopolysaccharide family [Paenibacillus curdlanolyticus YK9]
MSRWRNKLIMLGGVESPHIDLYRSLRAQLDYAASASRKSITIVAVAAPHRGNGVTETVANLAIAYAQAGRRTLLVDGDLREPMLHKLFGISNRVGLSSILVYANEADEAVQHGVLPNLSIAPAGPKATGGVDLVAAGQLQTLFKQWREEYDVVLLDTPPLLSSAAAQMLAGACDGALLVLRSGVAKEEDALRVKALLETAEVAVLGTALTHGKHKKLPKRYSQR